MRILVIDNYDSFTYNLVHYLEQFASEVRVVRNDEDYHQELEWADKLVLSPGPGLPEDSGSLMQIIDQAVNKLPILGVCLGHQALGLHFGAQLHNLKEVHHGVKTTLEITDTTDELYQKLPQKSSIGHYHSWVLEKATMPQELIITALGLEGEIMSFKHQELPIWGVQYHPESVLTEFGLTIIENWIKT